MHDPFISVHVVHDLMLNVLGDDYDVDVVFGIYRRIQTFWFLRFSIVSKFRSFNSKWCAFFFAVPDFLQLTAGMSALLHAVWLSHMFFPSYLVLV